MVQNIENFGSELHVEGFGNPPNVIVLEEGEVKVHERIRGNEAQDKNPKAIKRTKGDNCNSFRKAPWMSAVGRQVVAFHCY